MVRYTQINVPSDNIMKAFYYTKALLITGVNSLDFLNIYTVHILTNISYTL